MFIEFGFVVEYQRTVDRTIKTFKAFIKHARNNGVNEILLVSGGQRRKNLDSILALEALKRSKVDSAGLRLGVAFNPYFQSNDERNTEMERLHRKVKCNLKQICVTFAHDFLSRAPGVVRFSIFHLATVRH